MLGFQTILVSCVTAGAVIAYGTYRLSGSNRLSSRNERAKLIDEICEERESLRRVMAALPEQLELAKRAGLTAADATELLTAEAAGRWLSDFESDLADATALESQLPPAEVDRADQTGMELDLRLAEILALSIRANRLAEKYRVSPHADEAGSELDLTAPREPPRALRPSLSAIAPS